MSAAGRGGAEGPGRRHQPGRGGTPGQVPGVRQPAPGRRARQGVELETKVYPKVRNHGEGPY